MFRMLAPLLLMLCLAPDNRADGPGPEPDGTRVRLATFNIAMGLEQPGELTRALQAGDDARLRQLAEILQRVRPDIVLLNEFDFDEQAPQAGMLNQHYLNSGQRGQAPIDYPWHYSGPVNTGVDSGLDLDGDGQVGQPGDAWGYGAFPGQYGMLVLSRYPLDETRLRTFRMFRWAALPGARRPVNPDGSDFHPDETWQQLRLSSKSHWDIPVKVDGHTLHLLAYHPTPPVFDGPEDRNGLRNFDETRFWAEYIEPRSSVPFEDDQGRSGGLEEGASFVIAGDLNADPHDGDSVPGAIQQLLESEYIDSRCVPTSSGGRQAGLDQGGVNATHAGKHEADTSDFNDRRTGNLRLDYLLPSQGLQVLDCGVFWPAPGEDGSDLVEVSDHRLVWMDIRL